MDGSMPTCPECTAKNVGCVTDEKDGTQRGIVPHVSIRGLPVRRMRRETLPSEEST